MVHCHTILSRFKRLVNYSIIQVPSNIWSGAAYFFWQKKNETEAKIYQNGFIQALIFHWQFFAAHVEKKCNIAFQRRMLLYTEYNLSIYIAKKSQSLNPSVFLFYLQNANFNFKRICFLLLYNLWFSIIKNRNENFMEKQYIYVDALI